ncbi:MAG: 2-oxo acid dehydrogenase subunit E2 [Melioribacter sp.]|uniref:2-oxo acid dehydrogenase subunit E2 n=1 Tax=Rosettibacter primus TaxID=3111523 RepID=UPI00247BE805|nr:2-oxo acid dehydrogenase subunit E2 [Melioribacter sp.]
MKAEIIMPQMGESITEGKIIKWHKKIGDIIKKDEIIYEITTDKVDTEIPSPYDGILTEIRVNENETAKVGTVVAVIETHDENEADFNTFEQKEKKIIDIVMPKMGESITSGTIIKWHKKVGEHVKRDEIILEISTDKVDTEIPSPVDGVVKEILYNENETVEVDTVIARILSDEEIIIQGFSEQKQKNEIESQSSGEIKVESKSKRFYSPAVLNIARQEELSIEELDKIEGTGIKGRVTKKDIIDYLEKKKSGEIISQYMSNKEAENKIKTGERIEVIPIDHVRQKIMQNMVKSRDTAVHVTSITEVDVTRIYNFINNKKEQYAKEGVKLTYLPFIAYAAIKALKEFPLMNAVIEEEKIIMKKYINLGIAIALEPNGLIVPNIKNADGLNIIGFAKAIANLSQKAKTKKLSYDDVTDGTFTITNYGVFGTLIGTPIINQPEVGILGVGSVIKKPVVIDNEGIESIAVRAMMYLSLSHDHRLIDGMLGGKFLKSIKELLENFDENYL